MLLPMQRFCGDELDQYDPKDPGRLAICPGLMEGLGVQLTHIIRAVRTSGLHKAAEKRHSMAVERAEKRCSMAVEGAGHKRSSSASRDSGLCPQVR